MKLRPIYLLLVLLGFLIDTAGNVLIDSHHGNLGGYICYLAGCVVFIGWGLFVGLVRLPGEPRG